MKLNISELFRGLVANSDPVAGLELAIKRLEGVRDNAQAILDSYEARRREALLSGEDGAVASLREERVQAEDERDAALEALDQIRFRLRTTRERARSKRWSKIESEYNLSVRDYLPKAQAALDAFQATIAAKSAAADEGYENETRALPLIPHVNGSPILSPELLDAFRSTLDRVSSHRSRTSSNADKELSQCATAVPTHREVPARSPRERTARATEVLLAPKLPDDLTPLGDGELRVRVLRRGYCDAEGVQCQRGRVIRLPRATAEIAAQNGALEILEDTAHV